MVTDTSILVYKHYMVNDIYSTTVLPKIRIRLENMPPFVYVLFRYCTGMGIMERTSVLIIMRLSP